MNQNETSFALTSHNRFGSLPVLRDVRANCRLDGVLFETTLRQTYRNSSERVLEVVYTFPLPHHAVLLGFASELNGRRQVGTVVGKRQAERHYEGALADGDAPVMLEALKHGLHTANIGNLKPGDELVLEVRFAQMLAFEQGRLRLAIPTTIAPRWGNAQAAGLQPQQVPEPSLHVDYPLALSVTLGPALAGATVECPTHACTKTTVEGELRIDLAAGAALDRDVVILVQPREAQPSLLVRAHDDRAEPAASVVMAALQPRLKAPPRDAIALKLLVDCSGSMGGDSIASARRALLGVLEALGEQDQVSLSRFGTSVEHVQPMQACSQKQLQQLRARVPLIEADLGGTAMEAALKAVFALPAPAGSDLLLLTDGEIWQIEQILADARASGHRVFAIGVGSSPAAGLLQALADASSGACEFATPGEALEAAAQRMLTRIRQLRWQDLRVDWGTEVLWQTDLPKAAFGDDTMIVFAGIGAGTALPPVRLLGTNAAGRPVEIACSQAEAPCPGDALPRIAAERRRATASPEAALDLSLRYQLMGPRTNCILVHERADAEKAAEQAELHRVPSMLAAGWGATSSVQPMAGVALMMDSQDRPSPSVWRQMRTSHDEPFAAMEPHEFSVPSFLRASPLDDEARHQITGAAATALPPGFPVLLQRVLDHLAQGGPPAELPNCCADVDLPADLRAALDQLLASGLAAGEAWLLLAYWIAGQAGTPADRSRLRAQVAGLPRAQVRRALAAFDATRRSTAGEAPAATRLERLGQALRRALG